MTPGWGATWISLPGFRGHESILQLALKALLPATHCFASSPDILFAMQSHPTSTTRQRWQITFFVGAVFCYWMGLYLYVPTLPLYVKQFSGHLGVIGLVLSMYGLWQALTRFPVGLASDLWGRAKPFILVGFVFTGLGAWLIGFAPDIFWIGVGRSITGLAAATWVPIVVVFCRFFPASQTIRASAVLAMAGGVARILATSSTGFLNDRAGYALAFNLAAACSVLAILLMLFVKETPRPPVRPSLAPISALIRYPPVLFPSLLNAYAQFVNWAVTFSFIPILAVQLGASEVEVSLLITINMTLHLAGLATTATLVHSLGARNLVRTEFLLLGLAVLLAAFSPTVSWLFLAQGIVGLATGIGYPALLGLSIRDVAEHERTAAMGLHQAVYGMGMFAGPFVAGLMAEQWGIQTTFLILGFPCLLLLIPKLWGRLLLVATADPVSA